MVGNNFNLILKLKLSKEKTNKIQYDLLTNYSYNNIEQDYSTSPVKREIKGLPSDTGYKVLSQTKKIKKEDNKKEDVELEEYDDFLENSTYILNKKNNWPKSTNLRCWFCTLHFETVPCAKPIKYEKDKFTVVGCYCSFNCVMADILDSRDTQKWELCGLVNLMYDKIHGETKNIKPSPNKRVLKEYGGELTRLEYKNSLDDNITTYEILLPPIINIGYTIQKIDRKIDKSRKDTQYVPLNFRKIEGAAKTMDKKIVKKKMAIDSFFK